MAVSLLQARSGLQEGTCVSKDRQDPGKDIASSRLEKDRGNILTDGRRNVTITHLPNLMSTLVTNGKGDAFMKITTQKIYGRGFKHNSLMRGYAYFVCFWGS